MSCQGGRNAYFCPSGEESGGLRLWSLEVRWAVLPGAVIAKVCKTGGKGTRRLAALLRAGSAKDGTSRSWKCEGQDFQGLETQMAAFPDVAGDGSAEVALP